MSRHLRWRLVSKEEVAAYYTNRCNATRGPRSTVTCEYPKHPGSPHHMGRSRRGYWFSWSEPEGQ